MLDNRRSPVVTLDGYVRSEQAEEKINQSCRQALNGPVGDAVMDYLRSITVNTVMPPDCSEGALRMQEGMRRLFGILEARRTSSPV
ncbi:MAG TPA: hypothetical protein VN755_12595 [Steroidobacteraceae bacterium]|nr:hypothetical protein [Steroidobacteraceae bacterium]